MATAFNFEEAALRRTGPRREVELPAMHAAREDFAAVACPAPDGATDLLVLGGSAPDGAVRPTRRRARRTPSRRPFSGTYRNARWLKSAPRPPGRR